ncbi:MAG: ABC transporter ATP-binding protein/permease, partial [Planctomycetes bacterium]|nr:ABC transporter ATP-binding protein/permease [Planctomycetota bacterium]
PVLTLIIFACVPLLALVSLRYRKRMKRAFTASKQSVATINASLENSISGIRVTKAYVNADKEAEKFEVGNREFVQSKRDAYRAMGAFHSSTAFITDVFNVIVLMAGGLFLYRGSISFGDYSAFIVSINLFIAPLTTMINFTEQYQNGVAGFERFLEILDQPPEYENPAAVAVGQINGDIEFRNVDFAYDEEGAVLSGVTLSIQAGETVALVGPSGGGKTTICHLIPNFYRIDSGEILLDGMNINDIKFDSLRRNIGIVQQDVYLFNASIRDNILYGRLDASQAEVVAAAKRANIHDYIESLEHGYDTVIGERGVRLSGGQKQRLSIARVFLKNPAILILDEATSALDNTTEVLIQSALDDLSSGRTTLVVAHRLSTIKNADRIAVIADGMVKEVGTHQELMRSGGIYHNLYNLQYEDSAA